MDIRIILTESKAFCINIKEPYTYSSGIISPIYTDNRLLISEPNYFISIIKTFVKIIKKNKINFDKIAGTATAGIPWASFLAYKLKKPMIYVRNEAKDHGKKNLIEGKILNGEKVLVIEDLISTGSSAINTIKTIKDNGGIVDTCIAIFTYNMTISKEKFKEENVNLITLTDIDKILKHVIKKDITNKEDKKILMDWKKDPNGWAKKYGFE